MHASRVGQDRIYGDSVAMQWGSVGSPKICIDCEDRIGEIRTWDEWEAVGLPASGFRFVKSSVTASLFRLRFRCLLLCGYNFLFPRLSLPRCWAAGRQWINIRQFCPFKPRSHYLASFVPPYTAFFLCSGISNGYMIIPCLPSSLFF